jgi:hypothetical protein
MGSNIIGNTITAITDATDTKRYIIDLAPGVYIEAPITCKSWVEVRAVGGSGTVRITPSDINNPLFTMAPFAFLKGITVNGVTNSTAFDIATAAPGDSFALEDVTATNCNTGLSVNDNDALVTVRTMTVLSTSSTVVNGIYNQGGNVTLNNITFSGGGGGASITYGVHTINAGAVTTINGMTSFASFLDFGIYMESSSNMVCNNLSLLGPDYGIYLGQSVTARFNASSIFQAQTDAIIIPNVTPGPFAGFFGFSANNSTGLDVNVQSTSALLFGTGQISANKISFVPGARLYGSFVDLREDDEGLNVLGELHVGAPDAPTESVLGGGDSYTRGMLVYTFDGAATYTDVSAAAASASGSTITLPGTGVNNAFYLASTLQDASDYLQFFGVKVKVDTARTGGDMIIEYWNGATWEEFHHMNTESGGSYYPYAEDIFLRTGSEQIRFDGLITDWAKNDPMTLGTSYFWIRMRVNSALTSAPVIEQFKLHSNRFEVNSDGFIEYFGTGRPFANLPWDQGLVQAAAASPGDQDVYLSDNLDVGRIENSFANTATDRIGFNTFLPADVDTSTPIRFRWAWFTDDATANGVDWVIRWGWNTDGDSVYPSQTAAPATAPNEQSISTTINAPGAINQMTISEVELDISGTRARRSGGFGDMLWVSLQRTAGDAHAGDIAVVNVQGSYLKWSDGGHLT